MKSPQLFDLSGKVALVTGAGSGIGRGGSIALAQAGAAVCCVDISYDRAAETARSVREEGRRAAVITADVTREADCRRMVESCEADMGTLDIAWANAGIGGSRGEFTELKLEDWQRVIDLDLTSVFLTFREAARAMLPRGRGKLLATASIWGLGAAFREQSSPDYMAAKAGVVNIVRTTSNMLARKGITANALCPGFTKTAIAGSFYYRTDAEATRVHDQLVARVPLGRLMEVDDLLGAIVFLASPASDFMTGQTLVVDGGFLAY